jgi:biopolymer transport protein ExbD
MRIDRPARKKSRISLTPLIDVVFLLLIFFMLASTFLHYNGLDLAGGRSGAAQKNELEQLVLVRIKNGAVLDINGKPIHLSQLTGELEALGRDKELKVAIKPMEGVKVQDVVDVIERARIKAVRDVMVVK